MGYRDTIPCVSALLISAFREKSIFMPDENPVIVLLYMYTQVYM